METIIIAIISTLGVIITTIIQSITTHRTKKFEEQIQSLDNKLETRTNELKEEIKENRVETIKNFLIRTFNDLNAGEPVDQTTKLRLHEQYDIYTNKFHKNSYIHNEYEKLKKEGKL